MLAMGNEVLAAQNIFSETAIVTIFHVGQGYEG